MQELFYYAQMEQLTPFITRGINRCGARVRKSTFIHVYDILLRFDCLFRRASEFHFSAGIEQNNYADKNVVWM